MVKHIKIGKLSIVAVFRYRWGKDEQKIDKFLMWREWRLGVWFKKTKSVGEKDFSDPSKWKNNLRGSYYFGADLLVIKAWLKISYGVKYF